MNKKVALIFAIAVAFFSIVLVSSFGLLPEDLRKNVVMTDLTFNIEKDKDGEKCIEMNFKANNNTVNLYQYVVYAPFDTTNVTLQFYSDQSTQKVAISSTGMVTIYDLSLNSFIVSVASTDGSNLIDKIVIKKPSSNVADFEEDWEWGIS